MLLAVANMSTVGVPHVPKIQVMISCEHRHASPRSPMSLSPTWAEAREPPGPGRGRRRSAVGRAGGRATGFRSQFRGGDSTLLLLADMAETGGLLSRQDSLECVWP